MDASSAVSVEVEGFVATARLCRPEVHNAFDPELIVQLTELFGDLPRRSDVRAVVLRGEGKSFCAGADLRYMQSVASYELAENEADARRLAALFRTIDECPLPVVGRVHGAALGGGMGLVACCDVVVAARGARFGFTEARLGIAPAVISPFVVRKIGPGAARELFLTARQFTVDEALRHGLVHRVAEPHELDAAVQGVLADLLACGPAAQAACKRLVRSLGELEQGSIDAFTTHLIAELRGSAEGRAGMEAFLGRRPAPWVAEPPPLREVV